MKIGIAVAITLLSTSAISAQEIDCDSPPYGDTSANYKKLLSAYQQAQRGTKLPPGLMVSMALTTLKMACEAKFKGGDRKIFYEADLTDANIESYSTVELTSAWFYASNRGPIDTYQSMSVADFAIDGPKLAAENARVTLTGVYILDNGLPKLYATPYAVALSHSRYGGNQPSVALLTDDASRKLRAKFLACDSNPALSQTGCQVEISGRAQQCVVTNTFGATRTLPCVNVQF